MTTSFKCGVVIPRVVRNMNITPETAMIDTVITIAIFWRLAFLVYAILTKVILQKQKTKAQLTKALCFVYA